MASDDVPTAETEMLIARRFDIVLKPVSHPELGDIRIDKDLFAVGRTELPFASARADVVAELSRRHAKLFFEQGAAYVADLGSKNGTTVNGGDVREKPQRLREGDEIRFGGVLACRVEFVPCAGRQAARETRSVVVTLTPERTDLGLEPIVVTSFPFLISKADEIFAQYRNVYPHQVNYVSRRHAHLFVEHGDVFVEDLGSTNGTFVDGRRIEERAVRLEDGARLAFGGNHFVYRVGIRCGSVADPTVTQMQKRGQAHAQAQTQPDARSKAQAVAPAHAPAETRPQPQPQAQPQPQPQPQSSPPARSEAAKDALPAAAPLAADMDRTTFIAAPHSFLDIFCVDPVHAQEDEVNHEAVSQAGALSRERPRRRGRVATFIAELTVALGGTGTLDMRRIGRYAVGALALICALSVALYVRGNPQRDMKALVAAGRFDAAAQLADRYLARHAGDAAFEALGAEALMKAMVPSWLAAVNSHAFDRARALAAQMRTLASHNREAAPLSDMLGWMGELEAFWVGRGGPDAPIAIYRDEPVIASLVARWNDDPNEHQRALDQIASYVPAFGDAYANALSHLRQLQSDDSVYVAALERLKAAILAALDDERPEGLDALPALIDDYAERYPRLAGLALVRDDLREYREIESDARAGRAQAAADALNAAHFATPPFKARRARLQKLVAAAQGSAQ